MIFAVVTADLSQRKHSVCPAVRQIFALEGAGVIVAEVKRPVVTDTSSSATEYKIGRSLVCQQAPGSVSS